MTGTSPCHAIFHAHVHAMSSVVLHLPSGMKTSARSSDPSAHWRRRHRACSHRRSARQTAVARCERRSLGIRGCSRQAVETLLTHHRRLGALLDLVGVLAGHILCDVHVLNLLRSARVHRSPGIPHSTPPRTHSPDGIVQEPCVELGFPIGPRVFHCGGYAPCWRHHAEVLLLLHG